MYFVKRFRIYTLLVRSKIFYAGSFYCTNKISNIKFRSKTKVTKSLDSLCAGICVQSNNIQTSLCTDITGLVSNLIIFKRPSLQILKIRLEQYVEYRAGVDGATDLTFFP